MGIIEADFTDKLAAKPYLNYHNPYSRHNLITSSVNSGKRLWGRFARNDRNANVAGGEDWIVPSDESSAGGFLGGTRTERPKGVPSRIRILAIDVPEFREVFDGECRVNLSRIYPDDIAPPKYITRKNGNGQQKIKKQGHDDKTVVEKSQQESIEIIQKSLARSLVRCRNKQSKRIGVELLEASVYDLNPNNMRRTYHFGNYKYDPGKYGSNQNSPGGDMLQRRMSVNEGLGSKLRIRRRQIVVTKNEENANPQVNDEKGYADVEEESAENSMVQQEGDKGSHVEGSGREINVFAEEEDEVDAPWNQYAWIEEMQMRISGHIPFGANVERASWISRKLFGNTYRHTVRPSRHFWHWFIPSFLSGEKVGGEDGIDGDYGKDKKTINRASSKPHAVIADGSAMQRVPGALRYLTKCCKEANVPLFIINDPRVWGGNTNKDLESAARDIRKTIKHRIVSNALTIKEGSMFERGRILGTLETEAKWQLKDAGRRTRQAVKDAAERLQKERKDDWSNLESKDLLEKLAEKKLISIRGGAIMDNSRAQVFGEICKAIVSRKDEDAAAVVETGVGSSRSDNNEKNFDQKK